MDRLLTCRGTERPSEICKALEVYQISTFPAKNAQEFLPNKSPRVERDKVWKLWTKVRGITPIKMKVTEVRK